jgi:hypothetical protein
VADRQVAAPVEGGSPHHQNRARGTCSEFHARTPTVTTPGGAGWTPLPARIIVALQLLPVTQSLGSPTPDPREEDRAAVRFRHPGPRLDLVPDHAAKRQSA